jgi:hypothetical protein
VPFRSALRVKLRCGIRACHDGGKGIKHAKRDLVCLLLLLGVMAIHSRSWAQASLVMISDMDRNLKSDGVQQSGMNADQANVIKAKWAEHPATLLAGQAKWQGRVAANFRAQEAAKIPHSGMPSFWADTATGLVWAKKDNGSDATWSQANEYCRNLTRSDQTGFRMPTIAELEGVFDQTKAGQHGLHPKGGIGLSGAGVWSSTPGNNSREKWAFSFYNGSKSSSKLGPSNFNRALCVRRSGE